MGGVGAGHKSERARRARLVNIQKARAARRRAPLPWRSGMESRVIEQLVWQWWMDKDSGQWSVNSGQKRQEPKGSGPSAALRASWWGVSGQNGEMQILRRIAPQNDNSRSKAASRSGCARHGGRAGIREADRPSAALRTSRTPKGQRPWAKLRVARLLGVSHTWVNKLVRRFEADPDRMRRKMAAFAPASIEKLEQAREETRRQRELGWLRGPIRYRRVKVVIQGKRQEVVAATGVEQRRRQAGVDAARARLRGEVTREFPRSKNERGAAEKAMPLAYRELPGWATGLMLPRDAGTVGARGAFACAMNGSGTRGTPRPVPFAFRRRRR
jgi:hypothetical protein